MILLDEAYHRQLRLPGEATALHRRLCSASAAKCSHGAPALHGSRTAAVQPRVGTGAHLQGSPWEWNDGLSEGNYATRAVWRKSSQVTAQLLHIVHAAAHCPVTCTLPTSRLRLGPQVHD